MISVHHVYEHLSTMCPVYTSPAPQAENANIHFAQKFDEMKHVTPFTASCYPRS